MNIKVRLSCLNIWIDSFRSYRLWNFILEESTWRLWKVDRHRRQEAEKNGTAVMWRKLRQMQLDGKDSLDCGCNNSLSITTTSHSISDIVFMIYVFHHPSIHTYTYRDALLCHELLAHSNSSTLGYIDLDCGAVLCCAVLWCNLMTTWSLLCWASKQYISVVVSLWL